MLSVEGQYKSKLHVRDGLMLLLRSAYGWKTQTVVTYQLGIIACLLLCMAQHSVL